MNDRNHFLKMALYFVGILVANTQNRSNEAEYVTSQSTPFTQIDTFENAPSSQKAGNEVLSFTEKFLQRRAGRKINLKKLLLEYSLVCPLHKSCGVDYEGWMSSKDIYDLQAFSKCQPCTCDRTCLEEGNCCPGTHYAYLHHVCVNTILYPKEEMLSYYMADECLDNYIKNDSVIGLCESQIRPCTSLNSGLIYKNLFCAQCNGENNCIPWKLDVECEFAKSFQWIFKSFSEIKAMIDEYGCKIQYQYPAWTQVSSGCQMEYFSDVFIDRCNVTGLWLLYDADIEWACQHLMNPYKVFKNVFCYICNPSHANYQDIPLIDDCRTFKNTSNLFLNEACNSSLSSDRLKPFQNVYCYACNEGHKLLTKPPKQSVFLLSDISESNDKSTLETQLFFSLVFHREEKVEDVKHFVTQSLKETFKFPEVNTDIQIKRKMYYHSSILENIISHYITVCGTKTLCNDKVYGANTSYIYSNPVCGECICDSVCAEYENCCPDTVLSKQPFSCLKTETIPSLSKTGKRRQEPSDGVAPGNESYKIIDTCIEGDHPLAHMCYSNENVSDIISGIPISTSAFVTYRNIYCYSCNNNKSDIILNIQARCHTYIEHELLTDVSQLLHSVKSYCHRVSFAPLKSRQCLNYDPIKASLVGGVKYVRKKMHPSKFESKVTEIKSVLWRDLKNPVKIVYSACNQTGYLEEHNILTMEICENETVNMMSLPEYRFENRVYKNFACFLCNPDFMISKIDLNNVTSDCILNSSTEWYESNENLVKLCTATENKRRWFPFKNMYCAECNLPPWQGIQVLYHIYDIKSPAVYTYLFSLSPEEFERLDQAPEDDGVPECLNGTYDFSVNQCRSLYCSEGYQLFNTTCKPLLETVSNHIYFISIRLGTTEHQMMEQVRNESTGYSLKLDLAKLCLKTVAILASLFKPTTHFSIQDIMCRVPSSCVSTDNSTLEERLYFDIISTDFIELTADIEIAYTESITKVRTSLINALHQSYFVKDLPDIDGNLHAVLLRTVETSSWNWLEYNSTCLFMNPDKFTLLDPLKPMSFHHVDKFLLCPHVKFNLSEASIQEDTGSMVLDTTGASFNESEYKIMRSYLAICVDDYERKIGKSLDGDPIIDMNNIVNILNIFTLFCTIVSLSCLFLTFTVHCIFSSLRTVPGRCVMLLCVSLFCSQGFFQFCFRENIKSTLCIFIGICIHYFWIAAFCAMHICSFHMFKVFYFNDLSNEITRDQRRLFFKYLLYFIFFPLSLVLTTVFLDFLTSATFDLGYGEHFCFISDFYIFVGTFLTPSCLIFLSNIIFFSLAFHKIRRSPNVRSNQEKSNFLIFVKLCTIVGVTWPLLIVDSVIDTLWFSFIVTWINSLQGFFIFVSFILNRRVKSLCSSILKKKSKQTMSSKRTSLGTKYKFTNSTRL